MGGRGGGPRLREHALELQGAGDQGSRPTSRINPNGTIPALADDGFNLFESLAINFYLARKSGRLLPADARGEALVLQWTLWAATECEPHIGDWYYHTQMLPPAERKPEVAADAAAKLPRRLQILDDALAGRDYLVGGEFTLADLNVAAVLFRAPAVRARRLPERQGLARALPCPPGGAARDRHAGSEGARLTPWPSTSNTSSRSSAAAPTNSWSRASSPRS